MANQPKQSQPMQPENQQSEKSPRRRRKRDVVAKIIVWSSILCWVLFVAAIVLIDQGSPEMQNVFSRFLELELREDWDKDAVAKALNLMYGVAGFSLLALGLKFIRHRRRSDRYPITLIILLICSILGVILLQGIEHY